MMEQLQLCLMTMMVDMITTQKVQTLIVMCITRREEESNNIIEVFKEEVVFHVEIPVICTGTVQIEMTDIVTKIDSAMDAETGLIG